MIGNIRKTKNGDYYLIFAKVGDNSYRVFSLQDNYLTKTESDILSDNYIYKIKPKLVKRLNFLSFLRLIRTAYETSND